MATDPVDRLAALLGGAVDRMEAYSRIATSAAARNARGEYRADDLLADIQTFWQQAVRDLATATADVIDAVAARADDVADPGQ